LCNDRDKLLTVNGPRDKFSALGRLVTKNEKVLVALDDDLTSNESIVKHRRDLEARQGEQDSETRENPMMKQIEVHGQRVELYSLDEGRSWCNSPQSIVAYGRREKMLRVELQNDLARIARSRSG